jgi:hypothetical protein
VNSFKERIQIRLNTISALYVQEMYELTQKLQLIEATGRHIGGKSLIVLLSESAEADSTFVGGMISK